MKVALDVIFFGSFALGILAFAAWGTVKRGAWASAWLASLAVVLLSCGVALAGRAVGEGETVVEVVTDIGEYGIFWALGVWGVSGFRLTLAPFRDPVGLVFGSMMIEFTVQYAIRLLYLVVVPALRSGGRLGRVFGVLLSGGVLTSLLPPTSGLVRSPSLTRRSSTLGRSSPLIMMK